MENFQDRCVWIRIRIRIRFVLRGWIRIWIRFVLRGWIQIRSISDWIRNPAYKALNFPRRHLCSVQGCNLQKVHFSISITLKVA